MMQISRLRKTSSATALKALKEVCGLCRLRCASLHPFAPSIVMHVGGHDWLVEVPESYSEETRAPR
jgi:hypothetical protein